MKTKTFMPSIGYVEKDIEEFSLSALSKLAATEGHPRQEEAEAELWRKDEGINGPLPCGPWDAE